MARTKTPKCPNCNVDLVRVDEFPIELFWFGEVTPTLYVCQNPDDVCGHFTIFGQKAADGHYPTPGELEA